MPKLHIPPLGTELILAADWTFKLYQEHRNGDLQKAAGFQGRSENTSGNYWQMPAVERKAIDERLGWRLDDGTLPSTSDTYLEGKIQKPLTLPAGTLLKIDRIYIRKGNAGYDSVSFWLMAKKVPISLNGRPIKTSMRFWAKLDDVNRIEFADAVPV
jgi:hypothetical protein